MSRRALGPEAQSLAEDQLERYLGNGAYVRLYDSGTAALLAVLTAARLKVDAEVLVPSFVCPSVAEAIIAAGLRPVLFDSTATAEPSPESLARKVSANASALLLPDYYGRRSSTFDECDRIAREYGLFTVADAAQSFGCWPRAAADVLRGDATIFSFGRTKPLNAWSGGAVVTPTASLVQRLVTYPAVDDADHRSAIRKTDRDARLRQLPAVCGPFVRSFGGLRTLDLSVVPALERQSGVAAELVPRRMSTISAALLVSQLAAFPARLNRWAHNAEYLRAALKDCPGLTMLVGDDRSAYPVHFPVLVEPPLRFPLATALSRAGIQSTWFHYPLHRLDAYRGLQRDAMSGVDWLWPRILCIPCRDLAQTALDLVASVACNFFRRVGA